MQFRAFLFSALLGMAFGVSSCGGNSEPPSPSKPPSQGGLDIKALYTQKCQMCHGAEGTLTAAGVKPLAESALDTAAVVLQIQKGKNTMPAFESQLSAEEIKGLSQYVIALRK